MVLKFSLTNLASCLFLLSLLVPTALSQAGTSAPTVTECGPRLLPLASCAPFVQGQTPAPTVQCCDSLKQVYDQQKDCLCLFLNGTALASLPINSTLALQLPALCSPQIDPSTCSSSAAPGAPASQVAVRRSPRASAAAAPTVTSAPRPSAVGFGMGKSSGYKLRTANQLAVSVAVIGLVLAKLM